MIDGCIGITATIVFLTIILGVKAFNQKAEMDKIDRDYTELK